MPSEKAMATEDVQYPDCNDINAETKKNSWEKLCGKNSLYQSWTGPFKIMNNNLLTE